MSEKVPCPECGGPMSPKAKRACQNCIGGVLEKAGGALKNLKPIPFSKTFQPAGVGKAKGPSRAKVYERLLSCEVTVEDENGEPFKLSFHEAIALGQARSAMAGNTHAWREIQDSLYGKQTEKTELTGADGKPLETTSTIIIQGVKGDGK